MLYLWGSPDSDHLADVLLGNLRRQPSPPFAALTLVVPNKQVQGWLRFALARGLGIVANLDCVTLEEFLVRLAQRTEPTVRLLTRDALQQLILGIFAESEAADPALAAVRSYVEQGTTGDERLLRRFQLAAQLARIFEEYGLQRPVLLEAWKAGATLYSDTLHGSTETWEREVWLRLFQPGGVVERIGTERQQRLISRANLGDWTAIELQQLPPAIHLFGFSYLPRRLQEIPHGLSRRTAVHLYTCVPSRIYLLPLSKRPREQHLALRFWGRPGQEYMDMLHRLPGVAWEHAVPRARRRSGLLQRLQQDIREGTPPRNEAERDDTLHLLACPGLRREIEVIGEEIWKLIRADRTRSAADRLRFNDIAIFIADNTHRTAYQAQIRSVFSELYDIPCNLIDLPLERTSRVFEAVKLLLALPLGQLTRPEMLRLMTHPVFLQHFPEANPDEWQQWCDATGILRCADRQDQVGTYVQEDCFNWDQGLRRVVLGTFLANQQTEGDPDLPRPFVLGDRVSIPEESPGSSLGNAALFVLLVRSLIADVRFARAETLTLTDWSIFLSRLVSSYLAGESDEEQQALSTCLARINDLRELDTDGRCVPYRIACEFVRQALEASEGMYGQFLAEGVVVSSLQPMRNLPFRNVFVCGLGEKSYPARDAHNPLDLLHADPQEGDVHPRERDKYLFLETLLGTRERLYLSYVARHARTGDPLEPCSLVKELLHILRHGYLSSEDLEGLRIEPPIHHHEEPEPLAATARQERAARQLRDELCSGRKPPPDFYENELRYLAAPVRSWLGLCELPDGPAREQDGRLVITFAQLRRFLECPLQGWAQVCLDLRAEDFDQVAAVEHERFVTDRLQETVLLRRVFLEAARRQAIGPADLAALYAERTERLRRKGQMPVGLFGTAEQTRHLRILESWSEQLQNLEIAPPFHSFRFGRGDEQARVEQPCEPITLSVAGPDRSELTVELHGPIEPIANQGSLILVARKEANPRDFLRAWLDHLLLTAAQQHDSQPWQALVLTAQGKADTRSYEPLRPEEARTQLQLLIQELLGRRHDYVLPLEAIVKFKSPRSERTLTEHIDSLDWSDPRSISSLWGPVPHVYRYRRLPEEEAQALVERRLGAFLRDYHARSRGG